MILHQHIFYMLFGSLRFRYCAPPINPIPRMIIATRINWPSDREVLSFCSACSVTAGACFVLLAVSVGTPVIPIRFGEGITSSVFVRSCVCVVSVGVRVGSVEVISVFVTVEVGTFGGCDSEGVEVCTLTSVAVEGRI